MHQKTLKWFKNSNKLDFGDISSDNIYSIDDRIIYKLLIEITNFIGDKNIFLYNLSRNDSIKYIKKYLKQNNSLEPEVQETTEETKEPEITEEYNLKKITTEELHNVFQILYDINYLQHNIKPKTKKGIISLTAILYQINLLDEKEPFYYLEQIKYNKNLFKNNPTYFRKKLITCFDNRFPICYYSDEMLKYHCFIENIKPSKKELYNV